MDISQAREIVEALANGINPITGEILSKESCFNEPDVIRALFAATEELKKAEKRGKKARRVGKAARRKRQKNKRKGRKGTNTHENITLIKGKKCTLQRTTAFKTAKTLVRKVKIQVDVATRGSSTHKNVKSHFSVRQ